MRNKSVKLIWIWTSDRLKVFLIWGSDSPFFQLSKTICAILFEDIMRNTSVKLFWIWASGSRVECIFKDFLSGSLVALLFGGTKPFILFWKRASWGTFMWSYIKFEPVVQEGMSFKQKVYGRRAKADHKGSHLASSPGELRKMQKFGEVQNSGVINSSTNL